MNNTVERIGNIIRIITGSGVVTEYDTTKPVYINNVVAWVDDGGLVASRVFDDDDQALYLCGQVEDVIGPGFFSRDIWSGGSVEMPPTLRILLDSGHEVQCFPVEIFHSKPAALKKAREVVESRRIDVENILLEIENFNTRIDEELSKE